MSERTQNWTIAASVAPITTAPSGMLQRKCNCGQHTMAGGQCAACQKKQVNGTALQTKLAISGPGDVYEQEADRIAEQVLAMPVRTGISGAPLRLQRFSGRSERQVDTPPASVDQALASHGRPLEPALRRDMEQRFGYDFSRVRVHSGTAAEQSARDVNAQAYTVGHDIVFGAHEFAPGTNEGRRLIAHELSHVVQQGSAGSLRGSGSGVLQRQPIGQSQKTDEQDPELEKALRAAERAKKATGAAAMIAASEVAYRLINSSIPNYANAISGVGYDENGKGVVARKSGKNGANIDITVGKGFILRLNNSSIGMMLIELHDALKGSGVPASPPGRTTPETQIGLLESVRQEQRRLNPPGFKEAIAKHEAQQKRVVELFASAKAVTRGNSPEDTALQNSIEWVEPTKKDNKEVAPKFGLLILTPTHDSQRRKDGKVAYFDSRIKHPEVGGAYDPTGENDEGIDYVESGTLGTARHPPAGARSAMQFFAVRIYIDDSTPITLERLSKTLIHETQHMAARLEPTSIPPNLAGVERSYQTEFNAYWVEARVSEKDCFPGGHCSDKNRQQNTGFQPSSSTQEGFGSETSKASSSKVKGSDIKNKDACKALLSNCNFESKEQSTNFKNEKQQRIFEHLIATYEDRLFDCGYVCNDKFRAMVDGLTGPVGVNLVNSIRIEELLNRVDECKPEMAVNDPRMDKVIAAVDLLDNADREFLRNSLVAFPKEAKAETVRQAEEKKEKDKQALQEAFGRGSGAKTEKHDTPVSFWLYLMRRLPEAGLKKVQAAIKAKPAPGTRP
jgi:hypothetical protein